MRRLSLLLLYAISLNSYSNELPLLLSATLQSESRQQLVAPMSDNWRVQVQWLKPEDQPVSAGELVAVFDAGNIQLTIEQLKTQLVNTNEQYNQLQSEHALRVLEAEFELQRRQLLLEKASIDAGVPLTNLSQYDYENYQLARHRAQTEANKAAELLATARVAAHTALEKQQLQINKIRAELADAELRLSQMSIYAEHSGMISYALHPWFRNKLFAGVTAQPGWLIAEVTAQQNLYIEAWVHERDLPRLQQAVSLQARFDIAPQQPFPVTLQQLAQQGEKRLAWGNALYYQAKFASSQLPVAKPMLGMGLLIEATSL